MMTPLLADRDAVQRSPFFQWRAPEAAAAFASLALSAAALSKNPLPNNDGVLYIRAAEAFGEGGARAAASVHPWPFYPALLACVSDASGLSVEVAAHLTGALLLAAVSTLLVALSREVGGDALVAWCAALVALSHPWLNRARILIVRDPGAWAFGLLALLLLLRSDRGRRAAPLAGWAVCGVLAVLCRPEAVVLMAAGPLTIALASDLEPRVRRTRALILGAPAVLAGTAAVVWRGSVPAPYQDLFTFEALTNAWKALAAAFPLPYGREYAPFILVSGLLLIPLVKTLKAMGIVHVGLACVGGASGGTCERFKRTALATTLLASILPLYVQVLRLLFVESRYAVFATLLLSILAPFGLAPLLRPQASRGQRLAGVALVTALVSTALLNFPLRAKSEDQILAAADWIRTQAPGARLHTSNLQLAYRSQARVDWNAIQEALIKDRPVEGVAANGDLWAVRLPGDTASASETGLAGGFRRVTSFSGPDGASLTLFRCEAPVCRAEGR